jgi:hypothetical protein
LSAQADIVCLAAISIAEISFCQKGS